MIIHPSEQALFECINTCAVCRRLDVTANHGEGHGVLIELRGHAVGVWTYYEAEFVFRNIANWDVVHRIADAVGAYQATLAMAEENRWVEWQID